jgi:serine/threonine protein phosphatase PrpC
MGRKALRRPLFRLKSPERSDQDLCHRAREEESPVANIHQIASVGVDKVTSGDCARVFGLGDYADGRFEALGFFCADGGAASSDHFSAGRFAASRFKKELSEAWRLSVCATASDRARSVLGQALRRVNRAIFERGLSSEPVADLSVSAVAGIVYRGIMAQSHLGNVRLILLRSGEFLRMTEDHTYSNALARRGSIPSKTELDHPYANLVSKRLGMGAEAGFQMRGIIMRPGDALIAATDGLGYLRSSRALNKRLGVMIRDWVDAGMPPAEIASLCAEQIRYYFDDARQETNDDATCLIMGFEQDDLARPFLPSSFASEAESESGERPRVSREIPAPRFPQRIGSEEAFRGAI